MNWLSWFWYFIPSYWRSYVTLVEILNILWVWICEYDTNMNGYWLITCHLETFFKSIGKLLFSSHNLHDSLRWKQSANAYLLIDHPLNLIWIIDIVKFEFFKIPCIYIAHLLLHFFFIFRFFSKIKLFPSWNWFSGIIEALCCLLWRYLFPRFTWTNNRSVM